MDNDAALAVVSRYVGDLRSALDRLDSGQIALFVRELVDALDGGRRVLIAGNGGSATTASHMASDLSAAVNTDLLAPTIVIALADNIARLTAIANDMSYEDVFVWQVEAIGRPGDVLVLISVSGESRNLLAAAKAARQIGVRTLAMLGRPGALFAQSDRSIILGDGDYGLSEDLHLAVAHIAVRMLRGTHAFRPS
ncbi:MAG TPA: SIS domain-containing protein [Acidimicrobiales bacterium]|nr:SIS domain-containing protein [Acidimicrobiales bacterium]